METEISIKDSYSEVIARIEPGESTEEIVEHFYYLMLAKGHHAVKNHIDIEE
jgi:hypothetical protein